MQVDFVQDCVQDVEQFYCCAEGQLGGPGCLGQETLVCILHDASCKVSTYYLLYQFARFLITNIIELQQVPPTRFIFQREHLLQFQ